MCYSMPTYVQHVDRSCLDSARLLTRRLLPYRDPMPTAMELDLGEKERASVMELRKPEMWGGLGDVMRAIFLKWDKGERS